MKKTIFVTATNTDIGKTYTVKKLLRAYALKGLRVGVMKPFETGVVGGNYPDATELLVLAKELNKDFKNIKLEDIVLFAYELPAAPFVASNGATLDLSLVQKQINNLHRFCDVLIVEGAGGLMVPLNRDVMMVDLIKSLGIKTVLVTHCSLGCINDTKLSEYLLDSYGIDYIRVFNCKDGDEFENISEFYFKSEDTEILRLEKDLEVIMDFL